MDWTYRLIQYFWNGIDWIYPPVCGGCNELGSRWCIKCQAGAMNFPGPLCDVCGKPQTWPGVCPKCQTHPPPYSAMRSCFVYDGSVRNALLQLKYNGNLSLADAMANPFAEFVRRMDWPIDLVVPVPLGKIRKKERGYNQTELLARPLAMKLNRMYDPKALERIRETKTQVGLTLAEREKNVAGSFRGLPCRVSGRKVLLVDDIATTGATIKESAKALRMAGADKVFAITIAKAIQNFK